MHLFTSLTFTTPASNILLIPSESPAAQLLLVKGKHSTQMERCFPHEAWHESEQIKIVGPAKAKLLPTRHDGLAKQPALPAHLERLARNFCSWFL
jgi:hypothetical protein